MPKLVQLYIRQSLIGFVIAGCFVGLLFYFNVANLWHLVTHTSEGWLAAFLLFMFNGIVFSGVQFGIAIMRMEEKDDTPSNGRPAAMLQPVPIKVENMSDQRRARTQPWGS
ncbi:hypothetical protein [Pseudaestuariivita rosea]|uniref:hypothetical protein n=1 Tax=Pseudaestuariivita rosea TaxID=2763263 RepID=UPI001ABB8DC4|nr:hypothetical protein [Pseudaestuariivita rosea]